MFTQDYNVFIKKKNEIFKRVELNKNSLPIKNGNCIIPEGVTSIGYRCFYECKSLTNIQLPSSLRSIGDYAFRSYSGDRVPLKQVEVPQNCKIGNKAFNDDCIIIRK